jgi:hypothetical protein
MIDVKLFVLIMTLSFGGLALIAVIALPLLQLRRAEFIRTYKFPRGLLQKLESRHPGFTRKESALVSRGLRQFFIAYLMSGKEFVSMPSVVADDLWHEFILYTRDYKEFCRRAFGRFLHHSPAVILSLEEKRNEGLRRVWWYTCKYENIDPANPTRMPLLFALDHKLKVPGGFLYPLDGTAVLNLTSNAPSARKVRFSSNVGVDFGDGGDGGGCGGGCGGGD